MPVGWPASPTDRIPCAIELGKHQGDLTESEASFLASHESIIALQQFGKQYLYLEDGVKANVAKIKKANPKAIVLHYWGFRGTGNKNYRAYTDSRLQPSLVRAEVRAEEAALGPEQRRFSGMVGHSGGQDDRLRRYRWNLHRRSS